MNILKIYNKYHLPENLQMHMLRVASCSNLILDNWNGVKILLYADQRVAPYGVTSLKERLEEVKKRYKNYEI